MHASASTHEHGFVAPGWSSLLTYELRLDGFVYLTTTHKNSKAILTTQTIKWVGGDLLINADAMRSPLSSIAVGVVDGKTGKAVPGYGLNDAKAFRGNSTAHAWVWSRGNMSAFIGTDVAINVRITGGARLYSIRGMFRQK